MDTQYQDNEEIVEDITLRYDDISQDTSLNQENYKELDIIQKNG